MIPTNKDNLNSMTSFERPPVIKLLTLGDSGSGKSSILLRYTDDEFSDEFVTTIGMDFKFKRIEINKHPVKVQIWDTAGQERFRTITQNYYRGAHGIMLVCSIEDDDSKKNIKRWLEDVRTAIHGELFDTILVMNKIDLAADQKDAEDEAQEIAEEMGIDYFITSAKYNVGVEEAFRTLIEKCYDRLYGRRFDDMMEEEISPNGGWLSGWNFWNKDKDGSSSEFTTEHVDMREAAIGNFGIYAPPTPIDLEEIKSGCCGNGNKRDVAFEDDEVTQDNFEQ